MIDDSVDNPACPRILFSEAEINSFYKPWSKALIVKILERTFSFLTVKRRLETLWARAGKIQVTDMANDFFLVRFSDADDYQCAAFDGPWKLAVTRIGNYIGKTVRLDLATAEGARARYARVCVEVDLTKPLLGKYIIDDRVLHIEYESLENICFDCGTYGHKVDRCPKSVPSPVEKSIPVPAEAEQQPEGDTGVWMIVCRRKNKSNARAQATGQKLGKTGSRFDVLKDAEVENSNPINVVQTDLEATPVSSPQSDPIPVLAGQLKQVLDATLAQSSQSGKPQAQTKSAKNPLKEVSNTHQFKILSHEPSGKVNSPLKQPASADDSSNEVLFSVPVSYFNPTFQTTTE
ncbi:hypothetical protein LINPERHAP1_LOCUS26457 [Linum perenne]